MKKFFLKYIALAVLFFFLFGYQDVFDIQSFYTNGLNVIAVFLINAVGIDAIQSGVNILLPTTTLKVLFGCNGLEALLLFWAGVIAYSVNRSYKLEWLIKGSVILYLINVVRIVFLSFVLEEHTEYFKFLHDYVTQDIMIFLAIITFLVFVREAKRAEDVV